MKKIIFILVFIPFLSFTYANEPIETVPVIDGKVVFTHEGKTISSKEKLAERMITWLSIPDAEKEYKISLQHNDAETGNMYCRIADRIHIEGNAWKWFDIDIRCQMIFEYQDNQYTVKVIQINFLDTDIADSKYTGESVLINKEYKRLTIKNASQKITTKTIEYMNGLFETLDAVLSD